MSAEGTTAAVRFLLDDAGGVRRIPLALLKEARDVIYAEEPALFDGVEVAVAGTSAFLWLPKRPRTFLQIDSNRPISQADLECIPGLGALAGAKPSDLSVLEFWKGEVKDLRNVLVWLLVFASTVGVIAVRGGSAIREILDPLSVYFAVALPVLPLFFRPAAGLDSVQFFRTGRLGRWQTAETQLLAVTALGFAAALALRGFLPEAPLETLEIVSFGMGAVICASAAAWVLIGILGYALPLMHALDTARAVDAYLTWRSKSARRDDSNRNE